MYKRQGKLKPPRDDKAAAREAAKLAEREEEKLAEREETREVKAAKQAAKQEEKAAKQEEKAAKQEEKVAKQEAHLVTVGEMEEREKKAATVVKEVQQARAGSESAVGNHFVCVTRTRDSQRSRETNEQ